MCRQHMEHDAAWDGLLEARFCRSDTTNHLPKLINTSRPRPNIQHSLQAIDIFSTRGPGCFVLEGKDLRKITSGSFHTLDERR